MIFILLFCIFCLILLFYVLRPDNNTLILGNKIPGLPAYPIIGNLLDVHKSGEATLKQMSELVEAYGTVTRLWAGHKLVVMLTDPKDVEIILKSNKYIEKAFVYDFLKPWLGEGLLTSTGQKWHSRRKALTKAFDFKMIEQFIGLFNANGATLVDILKKKCGESFDVRSFICKCTLDIICETSMGMKFDAQRTKECSFAISLRRITKLLTGRMFNPLLHPEILYTLFGLKSVQRELVNTLHGESIKVIQNREKELATEEKKQIEEDDFGIKEKSIFVDILLGLRKSGNIVLTDEDIREEVDTVMFAGHDSSTSSTCFTLSLLAKHQNIQQKVYEETISVMGDRTEPTLEDLNKLKYLERVILESLRLYPSVPVIARQIKEDIQLTNYKLPAGCLVGINIFYLHRNKEYHPNPLEFNPDNFLPEKMVKQHPYAYIPFSAGPRICLGRKFAILELKSLLSKLILNYKIKPGNENIRPENDMVLQSVNGFNIKIEARNEKYKEQNYVF